ncbi:MAG: helix-turn-helix transcriptional regulator [Selenomonadaceae bacterium]|nr:helix-turn-helix transcriptional regulator [Selenomonadaceae bacterium]
MTLGERIKLRRKELGLTQVQLGEMVHKSSQVISNWERGYTTAMSPEDLQNIAQALNVNITALMGDPTPPAPQKSSSLSERDRTANGGPAHASAREVHQLEKILAEPNLTYNGVVLGEQDIEKINRALELAFWDAKEKNKRKK